jgi:hypothetical protein
VTPAPPPPPLPTIKGLPEGVELVHIGAAKEGDYELINEVDDQGAPVSRIYPGPRLGASSGIIVKPADGYTFVADIKTLSYRVVKKLPEPMTITVHARFLVDNQLDADMVDERMEQLKKLPGYQAEQESK